MLANPPQFSEPFLNALDNFITNLRKDGLFSKIDVMLGRDNFGQSVNIFDPRIVKKVSDRKPPIFVSGGSQWSHLAKLLSSSALRKVTNASPLSLPE